MSTEEFVPMRSCAAEIDYTNYKGERSLRIIFPLAFWWGTTEHHPEPGWLLRAHALDRDGAIRDFAMRDIHSWREIA